MNECCRLSKMIKRIHMDLERNYLVIERIITKSDPLVKTALEEMLFNIFELDKIKITCKHK